MNTPFPSLVQSRGRLAHEKDRVPTRQVTPSRNKRLHAATFGLFQGQAEDREIPRRQLLFGSRQASRRGEMKEN